MSAPDPETPVPPTPPVLSTAKPAAVRPGADSPVVGPSLTPEEQMERFAQDLKENDWGHQPC